MPVPSQRLWSGCRTWILVAFLPFVSGVKVEVTTTGLPTDIPSIVERFHRMNELISSMKQQVQRVSVGVTEIETEAQSTGLGISQAENSIDNISALARNNTRIADMLRNESLVAVKKVGSAVAQMEKMEQMVEILNQTASDMTIGQAQVKKRIVELEYDVKKYLPGGGGGVVRRVNAAESTVNSYLTSMHNNRVQIDRAVNDRIRANFARATSNINDLAAEVKMQQATANDVDDGQNATNATGAAAPTQFLARRHPVATAERQPPVASDDDVDDIDEPTIKNPEADSGPDEFAPPSSSKSEESVASTLARPPVSLSGDDDGEGWDE